MFYAPCLNWTGIRNSGRISFSQSSPAYCSLKNELQKNLQQKKKKYRFLSCYLTTGSVIFKSNRSPNVRRHHAEAATAKDFFHRLVGYLVDLSFRALDPLVLSFAYVWLTGR